MSHTSAHCILPCNTFQTHGCTSFFFLRQGIKEPLPPFLYITSMFCIQLMFHLSWSCSRQSSGSWDKNTSLVKVFVLSTQSKGFLATSQSIVAFFHWEEQRMQRYPPATHKSMCAHSRLTHNPHRKYCLCMLVMLKPTSSVR